jgi:hypothetical protein
MRKQLKNSEGARARFSATFERYGSKNGYVGITKTVLLKNVSDATGKMVCDHLWFNLTKGFESLDLQPGDGVEFDARATAYLKGYKGRDELARLTNPLTRDYKLSHPTKLKKKAALVKQGGVEVEGL